MEQNPTLLTNCACCHQACSWILIVRVCVCSRSIPLLWNHCAPHPDKRVRQHLPQCHHFIASLDKMYLHWMDLQSYGWHLQAVPKKWETLEIMRATFLSYVSCKMKTFGLRNWIKCIQVQTNIMQAAYLNNQPIIGPLFCWLRRQCLAERLRVLFLSRKTL